MSSHAEDLKWKGWRDDYQLIEDDVRQLVISDHVFQESMHCLAAWPEARRQSYVYGWLAATYMRDSIIGIRRQMDERRGAKSLWKLLTEIGRFPGVVNADRFAAEYQPGLRAAALDEFSALVGTEAHLTRKRVREDLEALESAWRPGIREIAHGRIAHADLDASAPEDLAWRDLHNCIGTIQRVCLRYRYLLLQLENRTLLPANLNDLDDDVRRFWATERRG